MVSTRRRRKRFTNCVHIAGSGARDSMSVLLGDVLALPVPVSASRPYRVSLQRKKCCQQIICLNDESFSIAVCIDAKEKAVLGEMFGDAVRPARCV
jgi:hypothetical protein